MACFGVKNGLANALSTQEFDRFWKLAPKDMNQYPDPLLGQVWPMSRINK